MKIEYHLFPFLFIALSTGQTIGENAHRPQPHLPQLLYPQPHCAIPIIDGLSSSHGPALQFSYGLFSPKEIIVEEGWEVVRVVHMYHVDTLVVAKAYTNRLVAQVFQPFGEDRL